MPPGKERYHPSTYLFPGVERNYFPVSMIAHFRTKMTFPEETSFAWMTWRGNGRKLFSIARTGYIMLVF